MTLHSHSILENGKLKPGIYKIQNIQSGSYLDVEVYTRAVCGRPIRDLEEGRGFVCQYPSWSFVSDDQKWEIKRFGAGYTVQLVSAPMPLDGISVIVH